MNQNTKTATPAPMVMVIIWAAFISTTIIYAILPTIIPREPVEAQTEVFEFSQRGGEFDPEKPEGVEPVVLILMIGVAISGLIIGILWPRIRPIPEDEDSQHYLGTYQTQMIVRAAFFEAIGVYGLILFFLGAEMYVTWIFCGVAALALISLGPGIFSAIDKAKMMERAGR